MWDNLGVRDVKAIANAIAETAFNPVTGTSSLSRLRSELRKLNAPKTIIDATFNPDMTCLSNKIQKEHRDQRESEGIDYPDHFSLDSVKERLDLYDISNIPDKQALADIMIMLWAVFAVVSNGAKNLSDAITIASQALRHSPDNYTFPAQNYIIVNFRKRGQPYDQATAFELFDES
ncbi:hypothetical protein C1646_764136 [Rhizophagus diaphanus]|nr:hypothetical protein C1646_764136 [Rhizophagus diaphanus] [Rhizophagus sp. MUCL 43196]